VPALGRVMALTRNEHCVHERKGSYESLSFEAHVGLALGADIDLRIFPKAWAHALAVTEMTQAGPRRSLQFFDAHGAALHKIYAIAETDMAAFDALVARFRAGDQSPGATVAPAAKAAAKASAAIETARLQAPRLQEAWDALQDTHDFVPMLRRLDLARLDALRLAGEARAAMLDLDAGRRLLTAAAAAALPIMVFVGNHGMIQIHTGPVVRIVPTGPWINVLDPDFNLHLRETAVTEAWLVRKPTRDGVVTSVELFDAGGELIVTFFGKRKPGAPEDSAWRALAESLRVLPGATC
jgi:putative hemin transport protein